MKLIQFLITLTLISSACAKTKPFSTTDSEQDVKFIKQPYLLFTPEPTTMTVMMQLSKPSKTSLTLNDNSSNNTSTVSCVSNESSNGYQCYLKNLIPNTNYTYSISSGKIQFNSSFLTAPDKTATKTEFFIYGDTRTDFKTHNTINKKMLQKISENPKLQTMLLHVGDIIESGDDQSSWQNELFNNKMPSTRTLLSKIPLIACIGNHEASGELFTKYFPFPFVNHRYWSFDFGPVHISILDQYKDFFEDSKQMKWLEKDLATTSKKWKIILFHEPGYGATTSHAPNKMIINTVAPIAEQNGVQLVFAGHNHNYSHALVNDIHHFTVGGGGAPLYDAKLNKDTLKTQSIYHYATIKIDDDTLVFNVYDLNDKIFDTLTLKL